MRQRERDRRAEARLGILLGCRRTGGGSCGRRGRVFDTSQNRRRSIAAEIIYDRPGRLIALSRNFLPVICASTLVSRLADVREKENFAVARCRNAARVTWNYSREIRKRSSHGLEEGRTGIFSDHNNEAQQRTRSPDTSTAADVDRNDSEHRADRMCERIDNRSHLDGGQHGFPRSGLPTWVIEEQLLPAGVQEPARSDHVQSASQILQHYAH